MSGLIVVVFLFALVVGALFLLLIGIFIWRNVPPHPVRWVMLAICLFWFGYAVLLFLGTLN